MATFVRMRGAGRQSVPGRRHPSWSGANRSRLASRLARRAVARRAFALKVAAATLLALATWSRLLALDDTAVGVVLALNLVSVPVVLLLAPLVVGAHLERVTARVWAGAALVMAGVLSLIAVG